MVIIGYHWFHIRLDISSVSKVRFQQFKHFPVACNVLFHTVCLTQIFFPTQIWTFFALIPWINIHDSCILSRKYFFGLSTPSERAHC